MEPRKLYVGNPMTEERPQINIKVTLNIIPFGCLKMQESYSLQSPPEPVDESGPPSGDYAFPTETPISRIVVDSYPLMIITH
jgi:hypothetical protein